MKIIRHEVTKTSKQTNKVLILAFLRELRAFVAEDVLSF